MSEEIGVYMPDVTVRIPAGFTSPEEAAGFIQAAVESAMRNQGWVGGCAVIFRNAYGMMMMAHEGLNEYEGVFPHGGEGDLAERVRKLESVLNEIYPAIAGRGLQLQEAREDRAAKEWGEIAQKVYGVLEGKR